MAKRSDALSMAVIYAIDDGYTAANYSECPPAGGTSGERLYRIMWRRGWFGRQHGCSLEQLLDPDFKLSKVATKRD